ncbi:molybdate ABC transporter substrate-binding protein [Pectinatus brassicae]|uniref:Molybdate transport system substrate-binding protein n=1 Tax=Pectinatus brassicae TaxID=862415 RepID=A0A840UPX1_9FIRM|nr:molybdate ABC transporter substrate-binding protein [Pectinatus brassicae]MBB5335063.1 molybdate transport system substrate-binding protein [Pectinatus brassicae]
MKKKLNFIMMAVLAAMMLLLAGCGQQNATKKTDTAAAQKQTKIIVSAAASLKDVMQELEQVYKKDNPNVEIAVNLASSGSLERQIEQGAPADIFISASPKQMNALEKKELLAPKTRKDLLVNSIVLITPKANKAGIAGFADLKTDKVQKIAMGDPKSVPAGQYAQQSFTSMNYIDAIKGKLVYGNNVRAVLTWVENGDADCGVVYKTDAAVSDKVKIIADAPADSHKPIIYPVAILKSTKEVKAAQSFVDFLQSEAAMKIFAKYGFAAAK